MIITYVWYILRQVDIDIKYDFLHHVQVPSGPPVAQHRQSTNGPCSYRYGGIRGGGSFSSKDARYSPTNMANTERDTGDRGSMFGALTGWVSRACGLNKNGGQS